MLLFFDGFDHYLAPLSAKKKWDDGSSYFTISPGRFGGRYAQVKGSLNSFLGTFPGITKTVDVDGIPTIIFGCAMRIMSLNPSGMPIVSILGNDEDISHQVQIHLDPVTGEFKVGAANGGFPPGLSDQDPNDFPPDFYTTATNFIPPFGLWFFLEVKVSASGGVVVRVDGDDILNLTGQTTLVNTATGYRAVRITAQSAFDQTVHVDDFYICDTTGTKNNDFLDECRIEYREPFADGFTTDFTPSPSTGPTNFQNVNGLAEWTEQTNGPPDNFVAYNQSATLDAIDLFDVVDYTRDGTIFGVQVNMAVRKDDVGNRKVAAILRSGGTVYVGTSTKVYSDYVYVGHIWENNPDGDIDWTRSAVNASESGVKITE